MSDVALATAAADGPLGDLVRPRSISTADAVRFEQYLAKIFTALGLDLRHLRVGGRDHHRFCARPTACDSGCPGRRSHRDDPLLSPPAGGPSSAHRQGHRDVPLGLGEGARRAGCQEPGINLGSTLREPTATPRTSIFGGSRQVGG